MNIDIQQLSKIIRDVSASTLMPHYQQVRRQYKKDGSIVTVADTQVQAAMTHALTQAYPDIALLGEEMTPQQQHTSLASGKALWCLDPIDGTSNFAAAMPYFSISLALIENGQTRIGLVYDPVRDECFTAVIGHGAWLNNTPLVAESSGLTLSQTIALIDFKRLPKTVRQHLVLEPPFGSQRNLGSIALELCWIAAGRGHIYLHGSQHLWDYAAAQLIVKEAGGFMCHPNGDPIDVLNLHKQAACAAVDQSLFDEWLNYLQNIPYEY